MADTPATPLATIERGILTAEHAEEWAARAL